MNCPKCGTDKVVSPPSFHGFVLCVECDYKWAPWQQAEISRLRLIEQEQQKRIETLQELLTEIEERVDLISEKYLRGCGYLIKMVISDCVAIAKKAHDPMAQAAKEANELDDEDREHEAMAERERCGK